MFAGLDSIIVSAIFVIVALVYMLNIIKPFLRDSILRSKSKDPKTYRAKQSTRDYIRVFGLLLGIVFATVLGLPSIPMIIIVGILLAAAADGSYASILNRLRLEFQATDQKTVTVPKAATVIQPPASTPEEVAAQVAAAKKEKEPTNDSRGERGEE